jgi:hypothetical protein
VATVIPGDGDRLWWSFDGSRGGDHLYSWAPGEGVQQQDIDVGPRQNVFARRAMWVAGVLGEGDVVLGGTWESETAHPLVYERTSGMPTGWQLDSVRAVSASANLVLGQPSGGRFGHCLALYAADEAKPSWTHCFERRGRPAEIVYTEFTPDGSEVVVLLRGGRYVGPAAIFHVGLDSLLVLHAHDGSVRSRLDHNFDRIVLEDDRHVVFTRHGRPDVGGSDEGPYRARLMRCSLSGRCESASPVLPASTFTGAVSSLPVG